MSDPTEGYGDTARSMALDISQSLRLLNSGTPLVSQGRARF